MTEYLLPVFLLFTFLLGAVRRVDVYGCMVRGARKGIGTAFKIMPNLICVMGALGAFEKSGLMDMIIKALAPLCDRIGMPSECVPLFLMKPLSGSGSLGICDELLKKYGADSRIGLIACTVMGSSETIFYVLSVYCGAVGVRKTRYTVFASLAAWLAGGIAACLLY